MPLPTERKQTTVEQYRVHDRDSGSAQVQAALLTERINQVTDHLKSFKNDHHARRGLLMMVGKRARLLKYIRSRDVAKYRSLIQRLGIRR